MVEIGKQTGKLRSRILVVEDEPDLQELLRYNLSAAGWEVKVSETGGDALRMVRRFGPDIVLLDLGLPDMLGTEVLRSIREEDTGRQPAVMILTGKGDEIDRIVGFELGADDYIVKPFGVRELMLRIRGILRRRNPTVPRRDASGRHYVVGPLELDLDAQRVILNGQERHVTPLEIRLLCYLAERGEHVSSREELLEHVWLHETDVSIRSVDMLVQRLRRKLGEGASMLDTVRGIGYRLLNRCGETLPPPPPARKHRDGVAQSTDLPR